MKDVRDLLEEPGVSFAIVGATDSPGKYGGIIYRDLKRKGYKVFGVNPNRDEVDGDPAFRSLGDIPEKPSMAVFVVPPSAGVEVVDDAVEASVENIWVQPGGFSDELRAKLETSGLNWLAGACVMVETR